MKIISKSKDYYDFVVFETDNRKVFVRKPQIILFDTGPEKFKERMDRDAGMRANPDGYYPTEKRLSDADLYAGRSSHVDAKFFSSHHALEHKKGLGFGDKHIPFVVCFCGKMYQGIYDETTKDYYYNYWSLPKNIVTYHKKLAKSKVDSEFGRAMTRYETYKPDKRKSAWSTANTEPQLFTPIDTNINKLLKSPVVILNHPGGIFHNDIRNAILEEVRFAKVVKPTDAYQAIYNFIDYPEPKMPDSPDDMDRYAAKGFDKKTSFRPKMK